jgi:hypothetical protein
MTVRRTQLVPEVYNLGALWLYREDLRAIAAAVNELGTLKITCTSGNSTYEGCEISDIDQLPEDLETVEVSSAPSVNSSAVTATFRSSGANITLVEPDTQAAGVLSRIRVICEPRRRSLWTFWHRFGPVLAVTSLVCFFTSLIAYSNTMKSAIWHNQFLYNGLPALLLALIFVGIGTSLLARSSRMVVIVNATRGSRPRYWQRTRDMWVVGVLTAVAGAVIGYVLGLLR